MNGNDVFRLDYDCSLDNAVILVSVIHSVDSQYIQNLLDENCSIHLIARVDNNGHLIDISVSKRFEENISIYLLQKVKNFIINNDIRFYVCFLNEPGMKIDYIKREDNNMVSLAIPGGGEFRTRLIHYLKYKRIIKE